ncbi:MAG TPA: transglycosylase SLT domain-containing protein [Pyrinomonadaceae bacterium]|jgi:soluble lytic murein transglycosylase
MNLQNSRIARLYKHRIAFVSIALIMVAAALAPFIITASCSTQRRSPQDEAAAIERLRAMTGGDVLPAETVVAGIETEFAGTRAAALARIVRARIRLAANDHAGAASLLADDDTREQTAIGDYALFMRAEALEKAGRRVEARAAFEELARAFPSSRRAREATLRAAELTMQDGQAAAVPVFLKKLSDADDARALLLTGKAYEQAGDSVRALQAYRRIYFYAPAADESAEAVAGLTRLNSTTAPATQEEALTRAARLFDARRHGDAFSAYTDAFGRFPGAATLELQLRRGIAASNSRRTADAISALNTIPTSAVEARAEALHYLAQAYAQSRQWPLLRSTIEEMRRAFPQHNWTMRALVASGQTAKENKNTVDAAYFYRAAVASFPGRAEVAGAQFELAWMAHDAKNFSESSRLLIEHLADYADKNTDNRGRAGYWAARDAERAGRLAEARVLYEAMQARYDANWYGHLAKQRLDTMNRNNIKPATNFAPDSPVARAVANLRPVTVAEETAGADADASINRADHLNVVGLDEEAHAELDAALQTATNSPRLNLAKARIFRLRGDNLQAFNVLRRSYPDYSQMKPAEMSREAWDVFYPLIYWDIITQEARARNLDPYMVAGLIRQESVFQPRAVSSARAYGLMQLLVPTGRLMAQRYGVERPVNVDALFEPRLNIQLGTGYLRQNLDKFGRLEYVAAAYNAGPGRAVAWRESLPLEMDEWAEAIPFRETRGYVQGVVRNMLQYRRLYDEAGKFRPEVGTRIVGSVNPANEPNGNDAVRPRRITGNDEED